MKTIVCVINLLLLLGIAGTRAQIEFGVDDGGSYVDSSIVSDPDYYDQYYDTDSNSELTLSEVTADDPLLYSAIQSAINGEGGDLSIISPRSCSLPNGETSRCYSLRNCPSLRRLSLNLNVPNFLYIQRHVCDNSRIMTFCCPDLTEDATTTTTTSAPPSLGSCGVSNVENIVGGNVVPQGKYPWLGIIGFPRNSAFVEACTASLINNDFLITAANCFDGPVEPTHVRLGEHNLQRANDDGPMREISISRIMKHPNYRVGRVNDDIALVRLSTPVSYTANILPICLPSGVIAEETFINQDLDVAGWGAIDPVSGRKSLVPMEASLTVIPLRTCSNEYNRNLNNGWICAGDGFPGTCAGDSGSPLMYRDDFSDRYFVAGVSSFEHGACDQGPSVFVRVASYMSWIRQNS